MKYPPGVGTTATEHPCLEGMPHFPDTGNGKRQWVPAWEQGNAAEPKAQAAHRCDYAQDDQGSIS